MKNQRPAGEQAVAPIIAIVLMVAITVIIATMVSAFALTLADQSGEEHVSAAVSMEVNTIENEIDVAVTSMGNAEFVVLRGDTDGFGTYEPYLNETGQQTTLNETHLQESGHLSAVAIKGTFVHEEYHGHVQSGHITPVTHETQVRRVEFDFSD